MMFLCPGFTHITIHTRTPRLSVHLQPANQQCSGRAPVLLVIFIIYTLSKCKVVFLTICPKPDYVCHFLDYNSDNMPACLIKNIYVK